MRGPLVVVGVCAALLASACSTDPANTTAPTAPPANEATTAVEGVAPQRDSTVDSNTLAGPQSAWEGRVDINRSGNRVSTGRGDLSRTPIEIALASPAQWLVPFAPNRGAPWIAVLEDGSLVTLDPVHLTVEVLDPTWGDAEPFVTGEGEIVATTARPRLFDEQLDDSRWVTDGGLSVVLTDPTERYGHGVLGDRIEAAGIALLDELTGQRVDIQLIGDVVEGTSAILADLVGDPAPEILVTQSNAETGARLVLYDRFGQRVAESAPIGLGNRWRNQLAVSPVGPNGEIEIIDIRTPHIGGTVEWFRVDNDRLVEVASFGGFTSHVIGSRNLDLAIVADPDADGRLEVVAPADDRRSLGVIARTADSAEAELRVELSDRLASNLGAVDHADGTATYAAGTADGIVRFWLPE